MLPKAVAVFACFAYVAYGENVEALFALSLAHSRVGTSTFAAPTTNRIRTAKTNSKRPLVMNSVPSQSKVTEDAWSAENSKFDEIIKASKAVEESVDTDSPEDSSTNSSLDILQDVGKFVLFTLFASGAVGWGKASERDEKETTPFVAAAVTSTLGSSASVSENDSVVQGLFKAEDGDLTTQATEPWILNRRKANQDGKKNKQPQKEEWRNRLLASLPYLLPLVDGLRFSQPMFSTVPYMGYIFYHLFAPVLFLYQSIPFCGIICFFGLSAKSRDMSVPKFVRFSCQQALLIDVMLITLGFAGSLASIGGSGSLADSTPAELKIFLQNVVFWAWFVSLTYSVTSNFLGNKPDKVPGISVVADINTGL